MEENENKKDLTRQMITKFWLGKEEQREGNKTEKEKIGKEERERESVIPPRQALCLRMAYGVPYSNLLSSLPYDILS